MRTVRLATFSVVGSSTVSLRQPFQLKLIVKYDSTTDSENYGGKMGGGGGGGLQSETNFWINFQLKLSKEKNHLDGLVFWKLRFNFDQFRIHIVY